MRLPLSMMLEPGPPPIVIRMVPPPSRVTVDAGRTSEAPLPINSILPVLSSVPPLTSDVAPVTAVMPLFVFAPVPLACRNRPPVVLSTLPLPVPMLLTVWLVPTPTNALSFISALVPPPGTPAGRPVREALNAGLNEIVYRHVTSLPEGNICRRDVSVRRAGPRPPSGGAPLFVVRPPPISSGRHPGLTQDCLGLL